MRNGRLVGSKAAADTSRVDLVTMMLGRALEAETRRPAPQRTTSADAPIAFKGYGKAGRVAPFDLAVHPGEVIGVAGLLGSGRTETAELLFGVERPDSGSATIDGKPVALGSPRAAVAQGFGFCPEDRKTAGIVADLSVRENIALALQARRGWARPLARREQVALADRYIGMLDIRTSDREKPVGLLSGGNQQKVILARWLALNPRFLILDEPTRGIDVGAHAEIIRLIETLCAEGMSLLVISSELEELVAYSSRVLVLRDRAHVAELAGADLTPDSIVHAIAADAEGADAP